VLGWINTYITKHPGIKLDRATQEKPRATSGKRNDLVVWTDRPNELAFLAIELKTPTTPINDPALFADALEKAQHWKARYFAICNMREIELYEVPPPGESRTPSDVVFRTASPVPVSRVEDWLRPTISNALERQTRDLLDAAYSHATTGRVSGHAIDGEIFVARLTEAIRTLRGTIYRDLSRQARASKKLRRTLNGIAAEQGFSGFVQDIDYAIAGQIGYRLIGQILFYCALRRKQPDLKEIKVAAKDSLPGALKPYWNDVRRYDYEALFKPEPIETLIDMPVDGQLVIKHLIEQFRFYDWASLSDDVLGAIFEHLIPREEQILLGQSYTPRPVADLLVAFTVDGNRPFVLDPGCGSGTFLMSAYSFLGHSARLSHKELLSIVWGFDISPFAAELAVINLYRQDMAEFDNFPRIVPGNFFERLPGQTVEFPSPRITAGTVKVKVPIPKFDCLVGNPPYLRSQNQDDLDPGYRKTLFAAAAKAGIPAPAKTDLFAFFIYHAIRFMKPGSRLGFVTPASWLTSDYAVSLQEVLLGTVRLVAVVASSAESFFPQVDVNAVLLVAERVGDDGELSGGALPIRFVTLKQPITRLVEGRGEYWDRVIRLVDEIESRSSSGEDEKLRVKIVDSQTELDALNSDRTRPRNWSKYLRAPLSYYEIFEQGL
jgi:methylase of polypeptide subunit release factors